MTVATKFELELRCNVCDNVLCINTESHSDKSGTWVYVEPCEKCSQPTPRAADGLKALREKELLEACEKTWRKFD